MHSLEISEKRIISFRLAKKLIIIILAVLFFDFFLFPAPVLAAEYGQDFADNVEIQNLPPEEPVIVNNLPDAGDLEVVRTGYYTITAYNSEVGQCDASPCITASGFNLCEHEIEDTVAANWLPFGAKIKIPDLFGDKVFVVRDRMNSKYSSRIDVYMSDKQDAKKFGIQVAKVEILEH